jgi:hypothetical protein
MNATIIYYGSHLGFYALRETVDNWKIAHEEYKCAVFLRITKQDSSYMKGLEIDAKMLKHIPCSAKYIKLMMHAFLKGMKMTEENFNQWIFPILVKPDMKKTVDVLRKYRYNASRV